MLLCTYVDPPSIDNLTATEICVKDFNISWTPGNGDTGIYYNVMISSSIVGHQIINTFFNFTALIPNTDYMVDIFSISSTCRGVPKRISVTTSTREAGVPRSELALLHTLLSSKIQRRADTI